MRVREKERERDGKRERDRTKKKTTAIASWKEEKKALIRQGREFNATSTNSMSNIDVLVCAMVRAECARAVRVRGGILINSPPPVLPPPPPGKNRDVLRMDGF